jgi:hypothetical protein
MNRPRGTLAGPASAGRIAVRTSGICRSVHPSGFVSVLGGGPVSGGGIASGLTLAGVLAGGETNLQQTQDLLWIMIGISVAGAIVTFSFLVYSVVRFRDRTKRRRYG